MEENRTNRLERKRLEEEKVRQEMKKQKELEEKRRELQRIIFDDNSETKEPKKIKQNKEKPKKKKSIFTNIILSLTTVIVTAFSAFLIYDSVNHINQLYYIINAILIFIIYITFLIAFKRAFTYNKTKVTILASTLLIGLLIFNALAVTGIINLPKQSYVPEFKTITEAITWAEKNDISYDQTFEYSDNVKKYNIINQSVNKGTLTKDIKEITFEVSNGPDYNKEVIIENMESWDIDDAVTVIEDNYLNNVTVNFEDNKEIEKDTITYQSKYGTVKRNDAINITTSLGDINNLKEITLKNLKNEKLFNATLYLNRNAIIYELKYEFSNKIEKGHVINQSIKEGTKVKPNDKITLTISKGKEIKVPKLENMKMSKAIKWVIENNLKINYSDKYDNKIKKGNIISSNYKEGDIIEEETTIDIIVSKGKLKMPNFKTLDEFKAWANKYQIKYEIKEEFSDDKPANEIIKFSTEPNKVINLDESIIVTVSKGKAIEVPDFTNKTKDEAKKQCDNLGLTCTFNNEYNTKIKDGNVISQNIKAGEKISKNDTITITIATNNKNNVTTTNNNTNTNKNNNKTNSNTRPNNSSTNNNTSSGNTHTPAPTCDKSKTKQVWLNAGGSVSQTKQLIQNQNPGIKFTFKTVDPGYGTTGSIDQETTNKYDGKYLNYCDTYLIKIIER